MKTKHLRGLVLAALLAAMSILLGKLLAINITQSLRISFENLPIFAGAILLGPLWGMAVGAVADLVGCLIVGYAINPLITLCAVALGGMAGLLWKAGRSLPTAARTAITVYLVHTVCSVFGKTGALSYYYGNPYWVLFGTRALIYAVTATLEFLLLWTLLRSRALRQYMQSGD